MSAHSRRSNPTQKSSTYFDDLTGSYNRRYLDVIKKEAEKFREKNIPFAVLMVDINHFRDVNRIHGHRKGDEVIKEFVRFLNDALRSTDIIVRYGGDIFACVMPNTGHKDIPYVYSRIFDRCRSHRFSGLTLTIRAGAASCPDDTEDFDELLRIADQSLAEVKRYGLDRVGVKCKQGLELPTKEFANRRKEIHTLSEFILEESVMARGAIIEGVIGIGKTRLVREILRNVTDHEVLWCDCVAFFEDFSYYPVRELIKYKINRQGKKILEAIPLAYRIELGKLMPELMEEVKEKVAEVGLVLDKYRLYESVRMIMEQGPRKKLIVIDNMQWVDRDTTETIKYLLRALRNQSITFVFAYRQEEKPAHLEDFFSYISRENRVIDIKLDSLEHYEIKEMIESIIGVNSNKELVSYVEQGSGGNPFYIEEMTKGLSDAGYLRVDDAKLFFDAEVSRKEGPAAEFIPKSIGDITEQKYQSLDNKGKEILEVSSVIGRFDINILKMITGYNEGHIIGTIENIRRLGLIREGGDKIEFREKVSRAVIYKKKMMAMDGRAVHKQVGEILANLFKDREQEAIEELALHFYHALDKERGVRYCVQAGDQAKEKYANHSAIKYYTWAKELLNGQDDTESTRKRIDCLLKRANVYNFIGHNDGALDDLEHASKEVKKLNDQRVEANIGFEKANAYFNVSQYQKSIDEAQACLAIFQGLNDRKGIANILNIIGNDHAYIGRYEKALDFYDDALKIFKEIKDPRHVTGVLNNLGLVYESLADYDKSLQCYKEAMEINREIAYKYTGSAVLNNIGLLHTELGEYDKALKHYQDSLEIIRETGSKYGEALLLNNIGIIYNRLGDYQNGFKFFYEALKIDIDIDDKHHEALSLTNIAISYTEMGDYEKARKYLADVGKIVENVKSIETLFYYLLSLGRLYLSMNRLEKAKIYLNKAHRLAKETNAKEMLQELLLTLSDYYLAKKRSDHFTKTIKEFQNLIKERKSVKSEGEINLRLGRYYIAIKDFGQASKCLRRALEVFEDIGQQLDLGAVYYYTGMLALKRGNRTSGQKALRKSLNIFKTIGARAWQEKAERLLKVPIKENRNTAKNKLGRATKA